MVALQINAKLPTALSIPDTELYVVFSNGLENAYNAASLMKEETLRTVEITCFIKENKLLFMIENPYNGVIEMDIVPLPQKIASLPYAL